MLNLSKLYLKFRRRLLSYVARLYCLVWPNKNYTFSLPDGSRFDYPLNSVIGRALFTGGFEIIEVEFMRQSLKPGNVLFDIGANGGLFTIIAAKQVGSSGHVYAFEPGLQELKLLRHNIAINNLTNVTVIEAAVSNKKGTTQFAISHDGAMNSLAQTNHPSQKIESWQTVEMTTIDNVIEELSIPQVNFIKIDVEGAEKLVIEGAKNILSSDKNPIILFEASDLNAISFGYSAQELISEIQSAQFSVNYLNEAGLLTPISNFDSRLGKEIYNFIALKQPVLVKH